MRRHVIVLAAFLASCGTTDRGATLAVTRDSAGVRIVENPAPSEGVPDVVTVPAEPVLVLGELDGPAMEQFGSVLDARLFDGGVAVLDGKNRQIRVFTYDGTHRRNIGAEGEGPGDMSGPRHLLGGDSTAIILFDWRLLRLTAFSSGGEVRWLRQVDQGPTTESKGIRTTARPDVLARSPDGRFLATTSIGLIDPGPGQYPGVFTYWLVDSAGHLDSIGTMTSGRTWQYNFPNGNIWEDSVAFAAQAADAFTSDTWYRTDGGGFQVALRSWDGGLTHLIRTSRQRRPVTPGDRNAFRVRTIAAEDPEYREDLETIYDWMQYPDSMPAYDQLAVDRTGTIWARVFPDTLATATWDLFSPDGGLLGTAHLPSDLVIRDVDAGHLLAQRRGELDEPLVLLYPLTRRVQP